MGAESGASGTGASGTGASGSDGGDDAPLPYDETKEPSEASCLVSDAHAVFVAPRGEAGDAGGDGTREAPATSITAGIAVAKAAGKTRVLVCNGTYREHVELTAADDGIAVYGGFRCPAETAPWTVDSAHHAEVTSPDGEPALRISDVTTGVVIADVDFTVPDATAPGASSVAAVVSDAQNVLLERVTLTAGKGADGAPGTLTLVTYPAASALKGNEAKGDAGGVICQFVCPGSGETFGGQGGNGGGAASGGSDGLPNLAGRSRRDLGPSLRGARWRRRRP